MAANKRRASLFVFRRNASLQPVDGGKTLADRERRHPERLFGAHSPRDVPNVVGDELIVQIEKSGHLRLVHFVKTLQSSSRRAQLKTLFAAATTLVEIFKISAAEKLRLRLSAARNSFCILFAIVFAKTTLTCGTNRILNSKRSCKPLANGSI